MRQLFGVWVESPPMETRLHFTPEPPATEQPVDCAICGGKGWFSDADHYTGEEVQVQCENCYGTGKLPKREAAPLTDEQREKLVTAMHDSVCNAARNGIGTIVGQIEAAITALEQHCSISWKGEV
jgi:hypothetical protein